MNCLRTNGTPSIAPYSTADKIRVALRTVARSIARNEGDDAAALCKLVLMKGREPPTPRPTAFSAHAAKVHAVEVISSFAIAREVAAVKNCATPPHARFVGIEKNFPDTEFSFWTCYNFGLIAKSCS